jgi:hypothetical protein
MVLSAVVDSTCTIQYSDSTAVRFCTAPAAAKMQGVPVSQLTHNAGAVLCVFGAERSEQL